MSSPELRRDLIRLANRERLSAEFVQDIIHLADMLVAKISTDEERELVTAQHILDFWKESFNETA